MQIEVSGFDRDEKGDCEYNSGFIVEVMVYKEQTQLYNISSSKLTHDKLLYKGKYKNDSISFVEKNQIPQTITEMNLVSKPKNIIKRNKICKSEEDSIL